MTNLARISQLDLAFSPDGAEALVVQDRESRRYPLGPAARRDVGGAAGAVPLLAAIAGNAVKGALALADGGTGLAVASPGGNKISGTDATGAPAWLDYPSPGNFSLADGDVVTAKLADLAVTSAKQGNSSITPEKIAATGARADRKILRLTGNNTWAWEDFPALAIPGDAIGPDELAPAAVGTAALANGAVVNAAVAGNAAILLSKLAIAGTPTDGDTIVADSAAVGGFRFKDVAGLGAIPDGGILTAKIADDAITGAKVAERTLTSVHLSLAADILLSQVKIGGTLSQGKFLAGTGPGVASWIDPPTTQVPAADTITAAMIRSNAITAPKIANAAVGTAALANAAVDAARLAPGAVRPEHIDAADPNFDRDVGWSLTLDYDDDGNEILRWTSGDIWSYWSARLGVAPLGHATGDKVGTADAVNVYAGGNINLATKTLAGDEITRILVTEGTFDFSPIPSAIRLPDDYLRGWGLFWRHRPSVDIYYWALASGTAAAPVWVLYRRAGLGVGQQWSRTDLTPAQFSSGASLPDAVFGGDPRDLATNYPRILSPNRTDLPIFTPDQIFLAQRINSTLTCYNLPDSRTGFTSLFYYTRTYGRSN